MARHGLGNISFRKHFFFTVILLTIERGKKQHTHKKPSVDRSVLSKQIFITENDSPFFQF